MKITLAKDFGSRLKGRFGKYQFEVGIITDGVHKDPKPELGTYAGGPIRKKARTGTKLISEVSRDLRERTGINYLTEPFSKSSVGGVETTASASGRDIRKFAQEFFKLSFGRSEKKRAENLLQAIVRNPILRGDYGHNSELTVKIKGFDRYMIDTAQFFRAIRARCKVRGR